MGESLPATVRRFAPNWSLLWVPAGVLLVLLLACSVWTAVLYAHHGSLQLRCGVLPGGDGFLDNSQRVFQSISWHLGNGLRTWGTTYGVKVGRTYASLQVTHVNVHWTRAEAREEE